jgi:hypothetical protein
MPGPLSLGDCTRSLTILIDGERLVSFLVSFVSVHHGPGYGGPSP